MNIGQFHLFFKISSFLKVNAIINDIKSKNPPIGNAEGRKNTPRRKSLLPKSKQLLIERIDANLFILIRSYD